MQQPDQVQGGQQLFVNQQQLVQQQVPQQFAQHQLTQQQFTQQPMAQQQLAQQQLPQQQLSQQQLSQQQLSQQQLSQHQIPQQQLSQQQLSQQQMMLCPVRLVYETQILVQPGEQIQPNQTLFMNQQNLPPWVQNKQTPNQMVYMPQFPQNQIPHIQQQMDPNQLFLHQNFNNYQQIVPSQMFVPNLEQVRPQLQISNMMSSNLLQNMQIVGPNQSFQLERVGQPLQNYISINAGNNSNTIQQIRPNNNNNVPVSCSSGSNMIPLSSNVNPNIIQSIASNNPTVSAANSLTNSVQNIVNNMQNNNGDRQIGQNSISATTQIVYQGATNHLRPSLEQDPRHSYLKVPQSQASPLRPQFVPQNQQIITLNPLQNSANMQQSTGNNNQVTSNCAVQTVQSKLIPKTSVSMNATLPQIIVTSSSKMMISNMNRPHQVLTTSVGNLGPRNFGTVPKTSYRAIRPRPQMNSNYSSPNILQNQQSITVPNNLPSATNVNTVSSNITRPNLPMNNIYYKIPDPPNNSNQLHVNRKRKLETHEETPGKIPANNSLNTVPSTFNSSVVPISSTIPASIGVSVTANVGNRPNEIGVNTNPVMKTEYKQNNANVYVENTNKIIVKTNSSTNNPHIISTINSVNSKISTENNISQKPDKDKLVRTTLFTQSRGRLLADKISLQDNANVNYAINDVNQLVTPSTNKIQEAFNNAMKNLDNKEANSTQRPQEPVGNIMKNQNISQSNVSKPHTTQESINVVKKTQNSNQSSSSKVQESIKTSAKRHDDNQLNTLGTHKLSEIKDVSHINTGNKNRVQETASHVTINQDNFKSNLQEPTNNIAVVSFMKNEDENIKMNLQQPINNTMQEPISQEVNQPNSPSILSTLDMSTSQVNQPNSPSILSTIDISNSQVNQPNSSTILSKLEMKKPVTKNEDFHKSSSSSHQMQNLLSNFSKNVDDKPSNICIPNKSHDSITHGMENQNANQSKVSNTNSLQINTTQTNTLNKNEGPIIIKNEPLCDLKSNNENEKVLTETLKTKETSTVPITSIGKLKTDNNDNKLNAVTDIKHKNEVIASEAIDKSLGLKKPQAAISLETPLIFNNHLTIDKNKVVTVEDIKGKELHLTEKGIRKEDRDNFILTHVLDGFVIQESNIAFPIRRPLKEKIVFENTQTHHSSTQHSDENGLLIKDNSKILQFGKPETTEDKTQIKEERAVEEAKEKENAESNPFASLTSETVKSWTIDQLSSHLSRFEWKETVSLFQEHEIDGESLFLVSKQQLLTIGVNETHADILCEFVKS